MSAPDELTRILPGQVAVAQRANLAAGEGERSCLVQAWIEIHRDELEADWQLAVNGEAVFKIEPLK